MRLLVVHLSDLHIHGGDDPVLSRAEDIVAAARNLDYEISAAVIAVTGDIAFSGNEKQYEAAWQFLDTVKMQLAQGLSSLGRGLTIPVYLIAVPGNHDCDLGTTRAVRTASLNAVRGQLSLAEDAEVVDVCTDPQNGFFEYQDAFAPHEAMPASPRYSPKLAYEYRVDVDGRSVRFLCLNTAWMSELHEQQGQLCFPPDAVQPVDSTDLTVVMFHHPYNWLEANVAHELRQRVEAVADVILTGHEHDAVVRTQQTSTGASNTYFEGGALQDAGGTEHSAFNAFILDLGSRKQKSVRLEWNGERYAILGAADRLGDENGLVWEELLTTRLRGRSRFRLSESMSARLADPGMGLTHPSKGSLTLPDVFVFPDLQEVIYPEGQTGRTVPGERIVDLVSEAPELIITGDGRCGKTSLAKMVFRYLHQGGYVPVLLRGSEKLPTSELLYARIVDAFREQYQPETAESYKQLDRSRRVLLVDDFHLLRLRPGERRALLARLARFAGRVILFGASPDLEVLDLLQPDGRVEVASTYTVYRIMPFGHLRRCELIDRWLSIGDQDCTDPAALAHRSAELRRILDSLIGRNLLPPYPFAILTILQAHEAGSPATARVSTYGSYYELLIRLALARGRTPQQSDVDLNYLAHLAYHLFLERRAEADEETFLRLHRDFENRIDMPIHAKSLREDLVKCHILEVSGDVTRFRYRYIYYYFVAFWMRDRIGDAGVREQISKLTRMLYNSESANILMFLAHLSKDPYIVGELLSAAGAHFSNCEPSAFTDDVRFLSELAAERRRLVYQDVNVTDSRNHYLARLDELDADLPERPIDEDLADLDREFTDETLNLVRQVNAALKTVDILGQLLRNFPGSLEKGTKLHIAKACYFLGLRTIAAILDQLREHRVEMVAELAAAFRDRLPRLTEQQADERATRTIVLAAELVGVGIVKRVSYAIGLLELAPTYDRVLKESDLPSVRLIDVSIKLDHSGSFPEGAIERLAREFREGSFPRAVLQDLALNHFYLFPVKTGIKQRICKLLDIEYSATFGSSARQRLIPG